MPSCAGCWNRQKGNQMEDDRRVRCESCNRLIDTYACSRTWINGRWAFFCGRCERNGAKIRKLKELYLDES